MEKFTYNSKTVEVPSYLDEVSSEQYRQFLILSVLMNRGTISPGQFRVKWLSFLLGMKADYTMYRREIIQELDGQLEKLDGFDKIVQLVQEKGLDMVTAYKAVNFGRATQASQAAGKQAAINAAKGKNHLAAHDGQAQPGTQKVMSESMLNLAKEAFPDKSDAEIQKLYNSI